MATRLLVTDGETDWGDLDLEITDLSFTYPPPRPMKAVVGVSLKLKQGEFVAVIGQNGSGKTTLAKCLSGFLRPTSGTVRFGSADFHRMTAAIQARHVGYVFQNPDHQLFKDTVWDDVAFGPRNLRLPPDQVRAIVDGMLHRLGLWERRDDHPHRLAKGDRQRLAVAGVAAMKPRVLVVDEPTTGQDPVKSREVMDLLEDMNKNERTTVLVITHSMELVAEYAKRVIVLCQGRVLLDGTPREVFSQPGELRKTFVEPPLICQIALELALKPLPLTAREAKSLLLSRCLR